MRRGHHDHKRPDVAGRLSCLHGVRTDPSLYYRPVTALSCLSCGSDSGSSLVCRSCRPSLSDYLAKKAIVIWHLTIVARAYDPARQKYQCFHCGGWFPREKVCGDHWPATKGSRPDLRYDISAGVTSCAHCNTSGSPSRTPDPMKPKKEQKKTSKPPLCKKCHRLYGLPSMKGLCVKCCQVGKAGTV